MLQLQPLTRGHEVHLAPIVDELVRILCNDAPITAEDALFVKALWSCFLALER